MVFGILLLCSAHARASRSRGQCSWSLWSCVLPHLHRVFSNMREGCFISIQPCILLAFGTSGQHNLFFPANQCKLMGWMSFSTKTGIELPDCMNTDISRSEFSSKNQDKYMFLNVFTPRGQFALRGRFQTSVLQVKLLEEWCLDSYIIPFGIICSFSAVLFCIYPALVVFVHIVLLNTRINELSFIGCYSNYFAVWGFKVTL